MMNREFTNIYAAHDSDGYLELLFYNKEERNAVFFDGLSFSYKMEINLEGFSELEYSINSLNQFTIESIRQNGDISFVKLTNGDIFQLYFNMDDNESRQNLSIFRKDELLTVFKSLLVNPYKAAMERFQNATDLDI